MVYIDSYASFDFQDVGHTGKLHNASDANNKHLGMFIFDLGEHDLYVSYKLFLYCYILRNTVVKGKPLFQIVPGFFNYPENINTVSFIDQQSLDICGWEPVKVPSGSSGEVHSLSKTVLSGDLILNEKVSIEFVFNSDKRYIGFLIIPEVTTVGTGFEILFGQATANKKYRPQLKCQPAVMPLTSSDLGGGIDNTGRVSPKLVSNIDLAKGYDYIRTYTGYTYKDAGELKEASKGIKIRGTDPAVNYSMVITHISLTDEGHIREIYGFNGYTERCYTDSVIITFEKVVIKKLNVVTWSGLLVEYPWASMLWYGKIIFFANCEEFNECCRLYFKEHGNDACPVCGNPLDWQLKYSFIDVTRKPHQLYFCSHDCLKTFNSHMKLYLDILTKPNLDYLLGIKM